MFDFFWKKRWKSALYDPNELVSEFSLKIELEAYHMDLERNEIIAKCVFLAVFSIMPFRPITEKNLSCERNLGSTFCLISTKKLMKSCFLVDFAKLITRPFCKQGLIAPKTVTLICRLFFGMRTRGCFRDQLFAFDCTLEYVVSSIHISWWGFEFHDGRLYLSIHKGVKLR